MQTVSLLLLLAACLVAEAWSPAHLHALAARRRAEAPVAYSGWTRGDDSGKDVDEDRIDNLIAERAEHRRARRFDKADTIRDDLEAMGVNLWDRERVWTYGDAPPPKRRRETGNNFYRSVQRRAARNDDYDGYRGGGRYDGGDRYGGGGRYDGGNRYDGAEGRGRANRGEREWNEWGHDYTRSDDDEGKINGAQLLEVNDLIKQRMMAKFDRNFDRADALLAELGDRFGVTINDGAKAWRADGKAFVRRFKRVGRMDARVDEARVQVLITERQAARKVRDYPTADAILAELLDSHGVVLDDAAWTWRHVGSGHDGGYGEGGGYGRRRSTEQARRGRHDYEREWDDSNALEPDVLADVNDLIARRMERKMARDFDAADAMQNELRTRLGVEVDDRLRTWRVAYPAGAIDADEDSWEGDKDY